MADRRVFFLRSTSQDNEFLTAVQHKLRSRLSSQQQFDPRPHTALCRSAGHSAELISALAEVLLIENHDREGRICCR